MQLQDRKQKEREFHDRLRDEQAGDPYYTSNKKFYSTSEADKEYVKKWLAERCKGKRVLDYCCGKGDFSFWLAEAGADACGIDISPVSITNATKRVGKKRLGGKVEFHVMDAEATDFPNDSFDLAVVNGVLHHLDLEKAYLELSRILKSDGEIICTEALRHNVFIHLYRKMTPHLRSAWEVDHILGKQEIEMARQYFDKVEVARFFHLATIGATPFRNLPGFKLVKRSLEVVDSVLLKLPVVKWQAWMVVFVLSRPRKLVPRT